MSASYTATPEKRPGRAPLFRTVLAVFLPLLLLMAANLVFLGRSELSNQRAMITDKSRWGIDIASRIVGETFATVVADVRYLSQLNEIVAYQTSAIDDTGISQAIAAVEREFYAFISTRSTYDQIRLLDATGMEVARVNYNAGAPEIVAREALQYKGDRYYFRDSVIQPAGVPFVSPLDLNIEQGVVETPRKPMIRFGLAIRDDSGAVVGAIIVNYLGQHLLDLFRESAMDLPVDMYLINNNGYWLIGPERKQEWGFMFPDGPDTGVWTTFPDEWETIAKPGFVQISTSEGLITADHLYPLSDGLGSTTGSGTATGSSARTIAADEYRWIVMSYFSRDRVVGLWRTFLEGSLSTVVIYVLVAFVFSIVVATLRVRRLRTEAELRESESRLRTSNATKDRLFSILAHDLRGPIGGIASLSSTLVESIGTVTEDDLRDYAVALSETAAKEYDLLQNLLTWAASQLESIEVSKREVPIRDLLAAVYEQTAALAAKKHLTLSKASDFEGVTVQADPDVIGTILRNFVVNAIKFTMEEGTIVLSAVVDTEEQQVTFAVTDSGIGIPADHLEGIFDVTNTFRRPGTGDEPSSGLGLVVCQEFAALHGGTVHVRSSEGHGSTFSLVIPLESGEQRPEHEPIGAGSA